MTKLIIATICLFFLTSCSNRSSANITILSRSPRLTLQVNAIGQVQWIWFQGPYQNRRESGSPLTPPSDSKKIILWKIAPSHGQFIDSNKVPPVLYGVVPDGWVQEIPENGAPPPLLDGYVYYVQAVTDRGVDAVTCISLKDGGAYLYEEESLNAVCGKRQ